jgi:hypothetical protein
MKTGKWAAALAVIVVLTLASAQAQQQGDSGAVKVGPKAIGGIVFGPAGAEAGVWVIAETTELPTHFARIVVTDDLGRYLIPDLPSAVLVAQCDGLRSQPRSLFGMSEVYAQDRRQHLRRGELV